MTMRTKLCFGFVAIFVCVDRSNAELRNVQEFNHIKEETSLRIQDRLRDGWPLEGKDKRCTDYEYLKSAVNGQIQCQIKCLYHKEFDCVGVLYSYVEKFIYFCALCKNDVLTDSTNGFGFYRNVEKKCKGKEGTYIGCYVDDGSRDLREGPRRYGYNQETCNTACQDYSFYALQNRGWCVCGNSYSTKPQYVKRPDDECGGANGLGGGWRNSVYETC